MVLRCNRPILRCLDHDVLPRAFRSPGQRRNERRGTLKRVPAKFRMESPNALLGVSITLSLRLRGDRVEREIAPRARQGLKISPLNVIPANAARFAPSLNNVVPVLSARF